MQEERAWIGNSANLKITKFITKPFVCNFAKSNAHQIFMLYGTFNMVAILFLSHSYISNTTLLDSIHVPRFRIRSKYIYWNNSYFFNITFSIGEGLYSILVESELYSTLTMILLNSNYGNLQLKFVTLLVEYKDTVITCTY